ncbi:MAG: hypothetical protein K6B13_10540 [Prevotella sp.]|nr:hypothetical protein [Prevotella sp.]
MAAKKWQQRSGSKEVAAKKWQQRTLLTLQTPPLPLPLKGGDGCALSYAVGKAIAIVPNEKIYQFVFLVFIGFYWFFLRPLRGINSPNLRRNYV